MLTKKFLLSFIENMKNVTTLRVLLRILKTMSVISSVTVSYRVLVVSDQSLDPIRTLTSGRMKVQCSLPWLRENKISNMEIH